MVYDEERYIQYHGLEVVTVCASGASAGEFVHVFRSMEAGEVVRRHGGTHVTEFLYDELGRVRQQINATGATEKEYTYTPNGNVASLKDGNVTVYRYDGFDRLEYADFPDDPDASTESSSPTPATDGSALRARVEIFDVADSLGRQ